MNPYDAHAQSLSQLQAEVTGSVLYGSTTPIPANVGIFDQQQVLDPKGGGMKVFTLATVIINKADLPPNTVLKTYQPITVAGYASPARSCKIFSISDMFTAWKLTVWDINQNA